jgi:hypothetical protein
MYRSCRTITASSVLVWLVVLVPAASTALAAPGSGSPPLTDEVRWAIVDAVAGRLVDEYVYPDVAGAMAARLRERFSQGAYESHTAHGDLLDALAEDLQLVQRDPHLGLRLLDDNSPPPSEGGEMSAEQAAFWKEFYDYENYGIYQVSRMEGNIGRIDLRLWPSEELAAGPLIAALELLKGVDALIVDVRRHLGGRAYPAQMVLSYLFEEPTHFATTIDRQKGITREQWTFGIIPGARLTEIPVFVLTSWETASGGELLPFVLQNTGRGTIIGETTRGAGSRTHRSTIEGLRVEMYIPHAVDVDPETGEGWDGVGVTPDVEVPAAEALATAHVMALEALLEQAADAPAYQTAERKWALVDKRAELEQATPSEAELREYTGTFGERRTWVRDGVLRYRRAGQDEQRLIPMIPDWFEFESAELYYVRLRFDRDEAGAVRRLVLCYDNGKEETFAPTNR